jgi:hypothetical protein
MKKILQLTVKKLWKWKLKPKTIIDIEIPNWKANSHKNFGFWGSVSSWYKIYTNLCRNGISILVLVFNLVFVIQLKPKLKQKSETETTEIKIFLSSYRFLFISLIIAGWLVNWSSSKRSQSLNIFSLLDHTISNRVTITSFTVNYKMQWWWSSQVIIYQNNCWNSRVVVIIY